MKKLERYLVISEVWGCIDMSGDMMTFPEKPEEFIKQYSFTDKERVYTNGSELIPVFRVRQMLEHYTRKPMERIIERLEEKKQEYLEGFRVHQENELYGVACGFGDSIKICKEEGGIE